MIHINTLDTLSKVSVQEHNVHHINSIKIKYPKIRKKSKAPTFALQYQGTTYTLMNNCGFSKKQSQYVMSSFENLYEVSAKWTMDKLAEACKLGYATLAFGLQLKTPLLNRAVFLESYLSNDQKAEMRSAGNALSGQSYGMLNNRAAVAFMKKVYASKFRNDIRPIGLIHDAMYFIVKDDIDVVKFVNDHLCHEMKWQDLPELQHPTVTIGGELDIYCPDWSNAITLPNNSTKREILDICNQHEI